MSKRCLLYLGKYIYIYLSKFLLIFLFITSLIFSVFFLSKAKLDKYPQKKSIFTFWEPHDKIPGYISLCFKTWKKFLPKYKINILDYNNIKDYLGENLSSLIIYKKLPLQTQADAIRVAILKKYGGIWMDADTIITNGNFIEKIKNYELAMIGLDKIKAQHIGFIFSSGNSTIVNEWLNKIIDKINYFKQIYNNHKNTSLLKNRCIFGNKIIDPILININGSKFFRLDRNKMNALLEEKFGNSSLSQIQRYRSFYFHNRRLKNILDDVKGIILLHNSFTPLEYLKMSEKEFLKQNILLSKILAKILNKKI